MFKYEINNYDMQNFWVILQNDKQNVFLWYLADEIKNEKMCYNFKIIGVGFFMRK